MIDTWKNIPGYDGKYQADKEGNVRRLYSSGKSRLMSAYPKKTTRNKRLVVKLTIDKKAKEETVLEIMAKTFLGPRPEGHVPYHKNGIQSDNYINNIAYISKKDLGKHTGAKSRRKPVAKLDASGEITEVYSSAREAARKNYMSYQTVIDRCNGKCKSAFAPDGFAYAWEDEKVSMRNAIAKIEKENGYMPKARHVEFEW